MPPIMRAEDVEPFTKFVTALELKMRNRLVDDAVLITLFKSFSHYIDHVCVSNK
jgi:hypothetical protein